MTMPRLLGIAGKKSSGKSTLGDHLAAELGYTRYAFADKVKEAVVALDPLVVGPATAFQFKPLNTLRREGESPVELMDRLKNDHPEVRRTMQAMGNEVGQGIFGQDFWVDQVLGLYNTWTDKLVCITDVRYPHEGKRIKALGGRILRIERPETDNHGDGHVSETSVDEVVWDLKVVNDSTVEKFLLSTVAALERTP